MGTTSRPGSSSTQLSAPAVEHTCACERWPLLVPISAEFTGKERDAETGLDYFGARYYGSAQGRFTSPDPIMLDLPRIQDPQQWNLYGYTRNNPFKFVDPDGRALVQVQFVNSAGVQSEGYFDSRAAASFNQLYEQARQTPTGENSTLDFRINNTLRTTAEQQELWNNRAANPNPVAQPGTSRHESGLAFDFDVRRAIQQGFSLANIRAWASLFGFVAIPGGGDPVHLEYSLGLSRQEYLDLIALNQADYRLMQISFAELKNQNAYWGTIQGHADLVNYWGFGSCAEDPWRCAISEALLTTGTINNVDSIRGH